MVEAVGDVDFHKDDVVVVATKTQHSYTVMAQLAAGAPSGTPVVCAQNGVSNEREALRWFERVYGVVVMNVSNGALGTGRGRGQLFPDRGPLGMGCYPAARTRWPSGWPPTCPQRGTRPSRSPTSPAGSTPS